eukprot:m.45316 g.45316  ORF g.45316 m.45316 type:complete len:72 (+) comp17387_c0_seq2:134-349(+)
MQPVCSPCLPLYSLLHTLSPPSLPPNLSFHLQVIIADAAKDIIIALDLLIKSCIQPSKRWTCILLLVFFGR